MPIQMSKIKGRSATYLIFDWKIRHNPSKSVFVIFNRNIFSLNILFDDKAQLRIMIFYNRAVSLTLQESNSCPISLPLLFLPPFLYPYFSKGHSILFPFFLLFSPPPPLALSHSLSHQICNIFLSQKNIDENNRYLWIMS